MEFPCILGSTNPCSITVHMEPFSTSVFKDLTWIFATTTKICTNVCFTENYFSKASKLYFYLKTSRPPTHLFFNQKINGKV